MLLKLIKTSLTFLSGMALCWYILTSMELNRKTDLEKRLEVLLETLEEGR